MPAVVDEQSDEQLIQGVASGDVLCLGALFERHHVGLYQYCLHLTRNRMMSEDLVQDVFLKLLKKAAGFRGDGSFKAWLFQIARNSTFDMLRKVDQGPTADLDDEGVGEVLIDHRSSERVAAGKQHLDRVALALAALPAEVREVIWLGRFVFESYEELGQALDCSTNNARVRMHRAMRQLHKTFIKLNGDPFDVRTIEA